MCRNVRNKITYLIILPLFLTRPSMGQILMGGNNASRRNSRCSLSEEFRGVELLNDHYLSPLTAPKETLAKFPPCVILVSIIGSLLFYHAAMYAIISLLLGSLTFECYVRGRLRRGVEKSIDERAGHRVISIRESR